MTREQAIEIIRQHECNSEHYEACEMAIKSLKQELCEDAIGRQAAMDCLTEIGLTKFDLIARNKIKNLPPVTPQPKMGHWRKEKSIHGWDGYSYQCSVCGRSIHLDIEVEDLEDYPYCHCGAKMGSEEEEFDDNLEEMLEKLWNDTESEEKRMNIKLDKGAFEPIREHKTDAGLDLRTPEEFVIKPNDSYIIDTGVHIELPKGYYGKLESKSGLNVKHNIVCLGGTIDEPYRGSIVVKLYNVGEEEYHFAKGDKIVQLVIQPYLAPDIEYTDKLSETDRGDNGFGSTGK